MVTTLTKHGDDLALVIDKSLLELLNLNADTPLIVSTDGQRLIAAPAGPTRRGAV